MKNQLLFKWIFFLVFISFLTSCATVLGTTLKSYPPKPKDCHLDVYMAPEDVKKRYEEICILFSQTGSTLFSKKSFDHAIALTKPKAFQCGADAIIVAWVEKTNLNLTSWGEGRAEVRGIRYK